MWEMAATSLHNDFLLDSERAAHRADACDDSLVASSEGAAGGEMEDKYRIDWEATDGRNGGAKRTVRETLVEEKSITMQEKDIKKRQRWCLLSRKLSSGSVFQRCGRGRRVSNSPGRYCGCYAGTSSTTGEFSLKDMWRSRSRPPRPLSLGQSGVVCSYVLCWMSCVNAARKED